MSYKCSKQYRIIREIGEGGFCTVHLAFDRKNRKTVAVKTLRSKEEMAENIYSGHDIEQSYQEQLALLKHEGMLLSRLHHPSIIGYEGSEIITFTDGMLKNKRCLILELFLPAALSGLIEDLGEGHSVMRGREKIGLALRLTHGVAYMHGEGIAHHDIKPDNILVAADYSTKIIDFAIGKDLTGTIKNPRCADGAFFLSPGYTAPEIIDRKEGGRPADIFSLGMVIYELIVEKLGVTEGRTDQKTINNTYRNVPRKLDFKSFSAPLRDLVYSMLLYSQKDRPTGIEVVSGLEKML